MTKCVSLWQLWSSEPLLYSHAFCLNVHLYLFIKVSNVTMMILIGAVF